MANSAFKKEKLNSPLTPNKGGTGLTSLTDKAVILGAGTGNVTTLSPGTSGNVLVSNGTSWTSGVGSLGDGTVAYSKLAGEFTNIVSLSTNDVDWSAGSIFTKTLSSSTSLTFSNYKLDKNIVLILSGNYPLSFPSSVNIIYGKYDGRTTNYITLHCTNTTSGKEEVWGIINQRSFVDSGYGYFLGGSTGGYVATADRITFSTGATSANTVSNLSQARTEMTSVSDTNFYGYVAGGTTGAYVATADRIIYSSGATSASTVSNLSLGRINLGSVSDAINYGYFSGGTTGPMLAIVDRITFSTSATAANTTSNLSQIKSRHSGLSDASSYGYFIAGINSSSTAILLTDRIVFSTGVTAANTISNLSIAKYHHMSISDSSLYGYTSGGMTSGGTIVNTADRTTFSTGATAANTVSNISVAKYSSGASSDGITYGYFGGGYAGGYSTSSDRINFSTGTSSANTASYLSQGRINVGLSDCAV